MLKEIEIQKDYLKGERLNSIYFGGGTPSLMTAEHLDAILNAIHQFYSVKKKAEITFEANPDDINSEQLKHWSKSGINRLSIGVQSFRDEDLNYLNRVHNSDQAKRAIQHAQDAGFENMSIDLIYGIPTLSDAQWLENIAAFESLKIPHLSAYALTVEPKTALDVLIRKGNMEAVNEPSAIRHFEILMKEMAKNHFLHYEISNFGKERMFSKHNMGYWNGQPYLGLGPSAHSYNKSSRQWNISNVSKYIESIKSGSLPFEKESLSQTDLYNEYVMTSLRTMWGIDLKYLERHFPLSFVAHFLKAIQSFQKEGKVVKEQGCFVLTNKGKLFADGIAGAMFY
jgi:oxygen-independent coproporphyrinogen-3 oxidase